MLRVSAPDTRPIRPDPSQPPPRPEEEAGGEEEAEAETEEEVDDAGDAAAARAAAAASVGGGDGRDISEELLVEPARVSPGAGDAYGDVMTLEFGDTDGIV